MLDLLRRREMPPAARKIGDARHVREGDNAAVLGADAELACRLSGEPAIGSGMWRAPALEASVHLARACDRPDGGAAPQFSRPSPRTPVFPVPWPMAWAVGVVGTKLAREFFEDTRRGLRSRAASRPSLPSSSALMPIARGRASPATSPRGGTGRARPSATTGSRSSDRMPMRCSIFCAAEKCRQPAEDRRRAACAGRR